MTGPRRIVRLDWGPDHLTLDAVVAYVDDELDAGAHGRADAHLAGCPQCRAEVVAQRQARSALRAAAGPRLPSSLLHTLRAIPAEAELPPPPPGLGITADGQFVLLRDVPRVPDALRPSAEHRPAAEPRATGAHRDTPGDPRRPSRRARFGAVSGLALGALAVGALATPGPDVAPGPGVLGGTVLDVPSSVPSSLSGPAAPVRAVPGEAVARLDVGSTTARPAPAEPTATDPTDAAPTSADKTGTDPTAADPTAPSTSATAAADVVDAALRQRLERAPVAFHHRGP